MSTLIITNGDSAVAHLRQVFPAATFLAWRDVLHEGPVPARASELTSTRAAFLATAYQQSEATIAAYFDAREELLASLPSFDACWLWFEHDLYDQLQLLHALQHPNIAAHPNCGLIQSDTYLTFIPREELPNEAAKRVDVTPDTFAWAQEAWRAFTSPRPTALQPWLYRSHPTLRHMGAAMYRLAEMYPSLQNGLNRTEQACLDLLAAGPKSPGTLFRFILEQEEAAFLGDSSLWNIVATLGDSAYPLLCNADGSAFFKPPHDGPDQAFLAQQLRLTPLGEAIQTGKVDWLATALPSRWIGGVHLHAGYYWRWEKVTNTFLPA